MKKDLTLPKIVCYEKCEDLGEDSEGHCPHCGAHGRYIYWFRCDDGKVHGAMSTCITHFPEHEFAAIQRRLLDKEAEYRLKGWRLASWDEAELQAAEDFASGAIDEAEAQKRIDDAEWKKGQWNENHGRKHYGRRAKRY